MLSRDQIYGGLILFISLIVAVVYIAAFFAPWISMYFSVWPTWFNWWAVAIPVFLFVVAALLICMWIGWTMLAAPPPTPLETEVEPTPASKVEEKESK